MKAIENNKVIYNVSKEEKTVKADTVIVSIGYNSYKPFEIEGREYYTIGDADKVSNLMGAIWSAYEMAMNI